jgi:hypothetical protein
LEKGFGNMLLRTADRCGYLFPKSARWGSRMRR